MEFRTGFLAGDFNLKVVTGSSLLQQQQADTEDSYRDRGDASISWNQVAVQLLILMSVDEVMDWLIDSDRLIVPSGTDTQDFYISDGCRSTTQQFCWILHQADRKSSAEITI